MRNGTRWSLLMAILVLLLNCGATSLAAEARKEQTSEKAETLIANFPAEPNAPTVCTIGEGDSAQQRLNEFKTAFSGLQSTKRFAGGFRWIFQYSKEAEGRLTDLAKKEHECCRFFGISVAKRDKQLIWEVLADRKADEVLQEYSRLPEKFKGDAKSDEETLKVLYTKAGLAFHKPTLWERFCGTVKGWCP